MPSRLLRMVAVVAVVAGCLTVPALAQDHHQAAAQPAIVVVGVSEIELAPDRASLSIAVETRGRSASAASSENARIQTAVLRAIRGAGIAEAQIQTQALRVSPEYEYPRDGGRPTVTGYLARNGVVVEVRDISLVGAVVDAALGQGATNVIGPRFFLANPDSARREALFAAVRTALTDAEVMARAAGLELGDVQEIEIQDGSVVPMGEGAVMMARAQDSAATPVMAGLITVRAAVRVRVAVHR